MFLSKVTALQLIPGSSSHPHRSLILAFRFTGSTSKIVSFDVEANQLGLKPTRGERQRHGTLDWRALEASGIFPPDYLTSVLS